MVEFLYPHGEVYIFENPEAQRVKVGMTGIGVNSVLDRLNDVNDMWLGRKVTCQVCGGRLVNIGGLVPPHVKSGIGCPGGNVLPLEKDVTLAQSHRESIIARLGQLSPSEKGSATRMVNTLEKRIEKYRYYRPPIGQWQFGVVFFTEGVAEVELLSHKILEGHLDKLAPFGEVFCCSVSEATEAVEKALSHLGLLHSARKATNWKSYFKGISQI
jgi:hypothetical protein